MRFGRQDIIVGKSMCSGDNAWVKIQLPALISLDIHGKIGLIKTLQQLECIQLLTTENPAKSKDIQLFHIKKRSGGRQLVKPLNYLIQKSGSPHPALNVLAFGALCDTPLILLAHEKPCSWTPQTNLGVLLFPCWAGAVVLWWFELFIPNSLLPHYLSIHPCPLLCELLGPVECHRTWCKKML